METLRVPRAKRLTDRLLSFVLLLVLSPVVIAVVLIMAVAMAVSRRERGPFLYREPRISQGRVFGLLKFRTLRADVIDELRAAGEHARPYESDRSNLTWTGRHVLKPWYLDELPQLLNVLLGEMSLVGPRAWPPHMVEGQVAEGYDYRNRLPAGLTGPAQVTKGERRAYLDLDLEYVTAYRTLGGARLARLDLRIIGETLRVIARGEGLNY